jgi:ABC-type transport system involved in multi-copper enzyme maturation permease subunit
MSTTWVIARTTIGEALRRKILNAFLMVGLAIIILTFAFSTFAPREELTLIKGMGLGIISLAGIFISVILAINLIPNEIEKRTIYTILSKPVRRHEFLLGKYFGAIGTVLINIGLMGLAFIVMVALKQAMAVGPDAPLGARLAAVPIALPLFKGILMIYLQLLLLCSLAVFFSVFLSPLVNFFLTLSLFIIGNLSSFTQDLAKVNHNPLIKGFFTAVHYLVPNFGNFNIQNPLINPDVQIKNEALFLTQNVIYALVYAAVLMILAILVFDRREV